MEEEKMLAVRMPLRIHEQLLQIAVEDGLTSAASGRPMIAPALRQLVEHETKRREIRRKRNARRLCQSQHPPMDTTDTTELGETIP